MDREHPLDICRERERERERENQTERWRGGEQAGWRAGGQRRAGERAGGSPRGAWRSEAIADRSRQSFRENATDPATDRQPCPRSSLPQTPRSAHDTHREASRSGQLPSKRGKDSGGREGSCPSVSLRRSDPTWRFTVTSANKALSQETRENNETPCGSLIWSCLAQDTSQRSSQRMV